jgi:hypothetical protein
MATVEEDARELARQGIEVWKEIEGCGGRYLVSNLGAVVSRARGNGDKPMKATPSLAGYRTVSIVRASGEKFDTLLVHRLVLQAFDGDPPTPAHTDVRHLDGSKTNNALPNLAWGTRSENMLDVHVQRGKAAAQEADVLRRSHPTHALDERLVRVGLEFHAERKLTVADLARLWDVSIPVATGVVAGATWGHIERPHPVPRKHRRTPAQVDMLRAWASEGLTTTQINERLPPEEHVTPQEVYYFRGSKRREAR